MTRSGEEEGRNSKEEKKGTKKDYILSALMSNKDSGSSLCFIVLIVCVDVTHTHTLTTPYYNRKQRVYLWCTTTPHPSDEYLLNNTLLILACIILHTCVRCVL